jgi:hypothetical protein
VGEHIATFDHNRWWATEARITHALFDVSALRPYPDDESVTFIDHASIERISEITSPGRAPYRQALQAEGITLDRSPLGGVSLVYTGHDSYHLEENGYGDFAWDIVRTNESGSRFLGDGAANEDYLVWDSPVYLPTSGYVVEVVRDAPDNTPGTYLEGATNNLVGIHLHGAYYLYLLHMREGSVPEEVVVDAYLDAGAFLGNVGNAGVTLEPHLHIVVLWYDANADTPRSWSVPAEFRDLWTGPAPAGPSQMHPFVDPSTGTYISSDEF